MHVFVIALLATTILFGCAPLPSSQLSTERGICGNARQAERAIAACTRLLEKGDDEEKALRSRAVAYLHLRNGPAAIKDLDRVASISSLGAIGHNNRGYALFLEKQYDRSLVDYDRAIELDSDYQKARNNRALLYTRTARFDDAMAEYEALPATGEKDDFAKRQILMVHYLRGEMSKAREIAETALTSAPDDDGDWHNELVYISLVQGKAAEAVTHAERAIAAEPDRMAFVDSLGDAFCRVGKPDEALTQFRASYDGDKKGTYIQLKKKMLIAYGRYSPPVTKAVEPAFIAALSKWTAEGCPGDLAILSR